MEQIDNGQIDISQGKVALVFFIPDTCAGCKRVIKMLQDKPLTNWTVYLINSASELNRPLIENYKVSMAPTIITFEDGEQKDFIAGLKSFIEKKDIFNE